MNLRETILAKHSKAQTDKIVRWIGHSQQRFDQLMRLFLHDEYRVTQRAGWPLSDCVAKNPQLIRKYFGRLFTNLAKKDIHTAVKRNTMRMFRDVEIPKRHHGVLLNTCLGYIESPTEAVAVKAFSLAILEKLLPLYPDIKNELKLLIEERWAHETAAFHVRARSILKKM